MRIIEKKSKKLVSITSLHLFCLKMSRNILENNWDKQTVKKELQSQPTVFLKEKFQGILQIILKEN